MSRHRTRISLGSMLIACALPSAAPAQSVRVADTRCDSVLRAARVDSVEVAARAYLVRRDGELLPPRVRQLLLESFLAHFAPPKPLQLPVFGPGPATLRMLRPEHLGDSASQRAPVLYGVYDFSFLRSGVVSRVITTVPSLAPGFDANVLAALNALAAQDSMPAIVTRALDVDAVALELRITTGPEDSRFRVPPEGVFTAAFPRLTMVDAKRRADEPLPEYPEDERDDGGDGEALLRVVIDVSGVAIIPTMEVVHATSPSFALAAARTLARYHFTPAHVGECPVPQVMEVPFWFSLRP